MFTVIILVQDCTRTGIEKLRVGCRYEGFLFFHIFFFINIERLSIVPVALGPSAKSSHPRYRNSFVSRGEKSKIQICPLERIWLRPICFCKLIRCIVSTGTYPVSGCECYARRNVSRRRHEWIILPARITQQTWNVLFPADSPGQLASQRKKTLSRHSSLLSNAGLLL